MGKEVRDTAVDVLKQLKFREIFKNSFETAGYEELFREDPVFIY